MNFAASCVALLAAPPGSALVDDDVADRLGWAGFIAAHCFGIGPTQGDRISRFHLAGSRGTPIPAIPWRIAVSAGKSCSSLPGKAREGPRAFP